MKLNGAACSKMEWIKVGDKSDDIIFKVINGQGQSHGAVKVSKIDNFKMFFLI